LCSEDIGAILEIDNWEVILTALLGALGGGIILAIFTKAIPRMMTRMMSEMMQNMREQMMQSGNNPADICRKCSEAPREPKMNHTVALLGDQAVEFCKLLSP